jgi:thioredoxin-related protein
MNPRPFVDAAAAGFLRQRRQLLAGAALAAVLPMARAASAPLPQAVSLADELAVALRHGEPLVVMVSLEGCPFCGVARNNYLAPLRAESRLEIVQVDMRTARPLKDFQGQPLTHDQMTRRWAIKLAPTVLFFGRGGTEVAERLVGGMLPDFYGAYLDQRLEDARRATRG